VRQPSGKPNSVGPHPLRGCERAIIPLGPALLTASSNLPGGFGRAVLERLPIWSCSVRGFACHVRYRPRGALLPHLFTLTHLRSRLASSSDGERYIFCATFRRVAPPGRYPAHCPAEFGLSSSRRTCIPCQRSPGRLPHSRFYTPAFVMRPSAIVAVAFGVRRSSFGVPPSAFPYPSFSCEISYCSSFL